MIVRYLALEQLAVLPQLDVEISDDVRSRLPAVVGGLSVALAATLKVIRPGMKVPHAEQWETAFRIFDTLL